MDVPSAHRHGELEPRATGRDQLLPGCDTSQAVDGFSNGFHPERMFGPGRLFRGDCGSVDAGVTPGPEEDD